MKKMLMVLLLISITVVCFAKYEYYHSLAAGAGYSYGLVGVRYQVKYSYLGVHGGLGFYPGDKGDNGTMWSAGIKLYPTARHFYLNVQIGKVDVLDKNDYSYWDDNPDYVDILGVSYMIGGDILFGYKGQAGLNWGIGVTSLIKNEDVYGENIIPAFDIGFIVRF